MATQAMYYGSLYWDETGTAATDNIIDTPIKAAGATIGKSCFGFSHSDNRLTYTGNTGRAFLVNMSASLSCSGATESTTYIALNGAVIPGSHVHRSIGTGGDNGALSMVAIVKLKKDDYIELWCETNASADDITIESGTIAITVAG
jgi:hypothetical protein